MMISLFGVYHLVSKTITYTIIVTKTEAMITAASTGMGRVVLGTTNKLWVVKGVELLDGGAC